MVHQNILFGGSEWQVKYNSRVKLYPDGCGGWLPVQQLVCDKPIFNPDGVELRGEKGLCSVTENSYSADTVDSSDRAVRRARARIYDLVRCNLDLNYFITLTFDGAKVQREDYCEVIRKFNVWADNNVRRRGLKYVGVVERHHTSNGLHFHLITNGALSFVDSGTVKCPRHKKPIKVQTANRYRIPYAERKAVYNIPSWSYGFSTAVQIDGDSGHVKTAHYIVKYITKDFDKIGGRYFYHGGGLFEPKYIFERVEYRDVEPDYEFSPEGANIAFKVVNL